MNWIKIIALVGLLSIACGRNEEAKKIVDQVAESKWLMEVETLAKLLRADSVTVLDLREVDKFDEGHIVGAINLWRSELQNGGYDYEGMIPTREHVESLFSNKGISSNHFLVLYDDRGGCESARLWWILNHYGFERMAILNGGIQAWEEVGSLVQEKKQRGIASFSLNKLPSRPTNISAEELFSHIDDSNYLILDTRSHDEYTGAMKKGNALDSGRIPGSKHFDWMEAVDPSTMKFKSFEELNVIYQEILKDNKQVVTYCHSGVRSAHTYFVLTELLGYPKVQNYDGSWVEWTYFQNPVERATIIN